MADAARQHIRTMDALRHGSGFRIAHGVFYIPALKNTTAFGRRYCFPIHSPSDGQKRPRKIL